MKFGTKRFGAVPGKEGDDAEKMETLFVQRRP
jgi:hypothetical protein